MEKVLEQVAKVILPILKERGVKRAGIFGSAVTGDLHSDSDVDILVEIAPDLGLLDFVQLKLELEEALGRRVDLIEYSAVKPILRERILQEQVSIL